MSNGCSSIEEANVCTNRDASHTSSCSLGRFGRCNYHNLFRIAPNKTLEPHTRNQSNRQRVDAIVVLDFFNILIASNQCRRCRNKNSSNWSAKSSASSVMSRIWSIHEVLAYNVASGRTLFTGVNETLRSPMLLFKVASSGYRQSLQKAIDHLITHTFLNGTFCHIFRDPDCLPLILQISWPLFLAIKTIRPCRAQIQTLFQIIRSLEPA